MHNIIKAEYNYCREFLKSSGLTIFPRKVFIMFRLNADFSKYHSFEICLFTEIFGMQMTSFSEKQTFFQLQ